MQVFVDSANQEEIRKWLRQGVVDGATTNPSIMFKDGVYDLEDGARELSALLGERPLSVEVTSNDPLEMLEQARELASWGANIVVKIPVINEWGASCLGVIHALVEENIKVNATAILSFNQAILAAKAGATYVSIFAGRIGDEGGDPATVIQHVRQWLDRWGYESRIIAGSIRSVMDIQVAAVAGADIITIPPQFLAKMVDHRYTRETVHQFIEDAEKTLQRISKAHSASAAD
jgi:transaldolase